VEAVARGDPLEKPFLEETLRDGKGLLGGQEGEGGEEEAFLELLLREAFPQALEEGHGLWGPSGEGGEEEGEGPAPRGPVGLPPPLPPPEEGLRLLLGEGEVRGLQVDEPPLGEELGELGVGEGPAACQDEEAGEGAEEGGEGLLPGEVLEDHQGGRLPQGGHHRPPGGLLGKAQRLGQKGPGLPQKGARPEGAEAEPRGELPRQDALAEARGGLEPDGEARLLGEKVQKPLPLQVDRALPGQGHGRKHSSPRPRLPRLLKAPDPSSPTPFKRRVSPPEGDGGRAPGVLESEAVCVRARGTGFSLKTGSGQGSFWALPSATCPSTTRSTSWTTPPSRAPSRWSRGDQPQPQDGGPRGDPLHPRQPCEPHGGHPGLQRRTTQNSHPRSQPPANPLSREPTGGPETFRISRGLFKEFVRLRKRG